MKIYCCSKIRYAPIWKDLRSQGYPIVSRWIDWGRPESQEERAELAEIMVEDIKASSVVLAYRHRGETLKGALIEIGLAMGQRMPIVFVGPFEDVSPVFASHPLWLSTHSSLSKALCFLNWVDGRAMPTSSSSSCSFRASFEAS